MRKGTGRAKMHLKWQLTGLSLAMAILLSGNVAAGQLNQSGYNIGVNAGGMWGESRFDLYDWETDNEGKHDESDTAALGGVQLGYRNFLSNGFMWGVEADYQRSGYDTVLKDTPYGDAMIGQEITDIVTARIKAGTLVSGNTLAYITGGYAYTRGDVTLHDESGHSNDTDNLGSHGWTVGVGVEHSINNNFSIKGEYLHLRTDGDASTYFSSEDEHYHSDTTFETNIFRLGLNYNF